MGLSASRARIAGILAIGLLMLSAPGALAGVVNGVPDARISLGSDPVVGDGIYGSNGTGQSVVGSGAVGAKLTFWISIQNDGVVTDSFKVKRSGLFNAGYRVRYYNAAGRDVTGRVNAGKFTTPILAPGAEYVMSATVKIRSLSTAGSYVTRLMTVSSAIFPGSKDAVRFTAALTPAERVFAIAFTNVDGHAGFNPATDLLIARLVDTNNDNTVNAGDTVETGGYPTNLAGTTFGTFGITDHTVTDAPLVDSEEIDVIAAGIGTFAWGYTDAREFYEEYGPTFADSRLLDNRPVACDFDDRIEIVTDSPSAPSTAASANSCGVGDDSFIDVTLNPS